MATELPGIWNPETDDTLLCVGVHQETHDVKSFTFVSPQGKQFSFQAGQYFRFEPDSTDADAVRCYSISSSPHRKNAITITVKRVAGGKVSNWLHDTLQPNALVRVTGPLGKFTRPAAKKYLFLSGGSGITPMMSMARELLDAAQPVDVVFIHAGRSPRDLIFRDELATIAHKLPGFRLHFLPENTDGERAWYALTGRISKDYLTLAVPDIAERVVMCCGPAPFMAAARELSTVLGVPSAHYFEESFAAAPDVPALPEATASEAVFKVEFSKQGKSIEVGASQTVLACAKKSGIKIPSSCASGLCGTCKSKLIKGSVDMKHEGGIRQREIDSGFFLPCCSKPLSDLVIER